MNNKVKDMFKKFSYSVSANLSSVIISSLVVLILPKFIGVDHYSHYQLFLFYTTYILFLNFGLPDGIYVRYAGREYKDLDKSMFSSQFWVILLYSILLFAIAIIFSINQTDVELKFILIFSSLSFIILIPRSYLSNLLLSSSRVKEYAVITSLEKIIFFFLIIVFFIYGSYDFRLIIVYDFIGKIISFTLSIYYCKDIIFTKLNFKSNQKLLREIFFNISVGMKIMISSASSILMIGVVRLFIEKQWSIEDFGKISLAISIINMMLVFANSIGIVIFPFLKKENKKTANLVYPPLRSSLSIFLYLFLIVYFPIQIILTLWLPAYTESMLYLALLFPLCIIEGKMQLLVLPYMKMYRMEKSMMKISIVSIITCSLLVFFINIFYKNIILILTILLLSYLMKAILSEICLRKKIKMNVFRLNVLDIIMVFFFITCAYFIKGLIGITIYTIISCFYLFIFKNDIKKLFKMLSGGKYE